WPERARDGRACQTKRRESPRSPPGAPSRLGDGLPGAVAGPQKPRRRDVYDHIAAVYGDPETLQARSHAGARPAQPRRRREQRAVIAADDRVEALVEEATHAEIE